MGTQLWETPVGVVVRGMDTLLSLNSEYGDMPPWGNGPEQWKINKYGLAYVNKEFPHLDKFLTCHVVHKEQENENQQVDDTDDIVENVVVEAKTSKLLRATGEPQSTTSGLEVPILGMVAIIFIILICVSRRRMRDHSKSL